jgi:NitT/TauT family transport system substrate-binding protein
MFTADGRMPAGCPEVALKVLSSFSKHLREKQIDLNRTYTMEFVEAAEKTIGSSDDKMSKYFRPKN